MKKIMNRHLHRQAMLLVLFLIAGFIFQIHTEKVYAENKNLLDIGLNDKVKIYKDEKNPYRWFRFCPPADGVISFTGSGGDDIFGYVRLTYKNSKGVYDIYRPEETTDLLYPNDSSVYVSYGVKKGVQYALHVKMTSNYTITSKFKKLKEDGGKKQSKAKTLKRGKKQYGMLPMGKKQTKWYKFKVPKTKTITVEFSGWTNNYFGYKLKVKGMKTLVRYAQKNNLDLTPNTDDNYNSKPKIMKAKLKKGTMVYLGVFTRCKNNGGYYYFKWK